MHLAMSIKKKKKKMVSVRHSKAITAFQIKVNIMSRWKQECTGVHLILPCYKYENDRQWPLYFFFWAISTYRLWIEVPLVSRCVRRKRTRLDLALKLLGPVSVGG